MAEKFLLPEKEKIFTGKEREKLIKDALREEEAEAIRSGELALDRGEDIEGEADDGGNNQEKSAKISLGDKIAEAEKKAKLKISKRGPTVKKPRPEGRVGWMDNHPEYGNKERPEKVHLA